MAGWILRSINGDFWTRCPEVDHVRVKVKIHSFMDLANEAKAVYRIKRICLVNTEKLDEYIEVMYSDDPE